MRRLHHEEGGGIAGGPLASDWASQQARYWEACAEGYEGLYQGKWSALENEALAARLGELDFPQPPDVLDLGCGPGLGGVLVRRAGSVRSYVGVDISPSMLAQARRRYPTDVFLQGGVEDVVPTLPTASFDLVLIIFSTLSYFVDPAATLKEAHRVLRPGGHVFASALSAWSLRRLIQRRRGAIEGYGTRGDTNGMRTPAWTLTPNQLRAAAEDAAFVVRSVRGEGALSGVAERPRLWACSEAIGRWVPSASHTIRVEGRKQ